MSATTARLFRNMFRRDPETYILFGVLSGVLGIAGYQVGRKGTNTQPEKNVVMPEGESMPWEGDIADNNVDVYKYKYYPRGDPRNQPREAPSALNSVTVPAALPKELWEKWNDGGYGRVAEADE